MINSEIDVLAEVLSRYISGAYSGDEREVSVDILKVLRKNGYSLIRSSEHMNDENIINIDWEDMFPFSRTPSK